MELKEFYLKWKEIEFLRKKMSKSEMKLYSQIEKLKNEDLKKSLILINSDKNEYFFLQKKPLLDICKEKNDIKYNEIVSQDIFNGIKKANSNYKPYINLVLKKDFESYISFLSEVIEKEIVKEDLKQIEESRIDSKPTVYNILPFLKDCDITTVFNLYKSLCSLHSIKLLPNIKEDKELLISEISKIVSPEVYTLNYSNISLIEFETKWFLLEEEFDFLHQNLSSVNKSAEFAKIRLNWIQKSNELLSQYQGDLGEHVSEELFKDCQSGMNDFKEHHHRINVVDIEGYSENVFENKYREEEDDYYMTHKIPSSYKPHRFNLFVMKDIVLMKYQDMSLKHLQMYYMALEEEVFNSFKREVIFNMSKEEIVELIKKVVD